MNPSTTPPWASTPQRWTVALTASGSDDRIELPRSAPPLAPVDRATGAWIPEDALASVIVGIDGPTLAAAVAEWAAVPELGDALDLYRRRAEAACGPFAELARGCTGSAFAVVTTGSPWPGLTVGVPASPRTDLIAPWASASASTATRRGARPWPCPCRRARR